ncbi:MAG: hypothetical protein PHF84_04785, partial [bacterium]|nr:hypothetical protein [bacterium]
NWGGGDRYLEIQVDADVMLPREKLTSVLYSLWARDVEDNSITHEKIVTVGWSKVTNKPSISSVPSGAVLMFTGTTTCPAGYTEVAAFRNRIPIGADLSGVDPDVPDNVNLTGGTKSHDHTISHTHTMRNHTHGGTTDPGGIDHSHSTGGAEPYSPETIRTGDAWVSFSVGPRLIMGYDAAGGGDNIGMQGYLHTHSTGGATAYSHQHNFGTGGPSNNTTDDASPGSTGTRTLLPPILTVIFCQKN